MTNSSINPEEMKFVLELVAKARENGIVEVQYKDLRLRLSLQAQQTGSGAVQIKKLPQWDASFPAPERF